MPDSLSDAPASPLRLPAGFTAAQRISRKSGFGHVIHAGNMADRHFKIFFARNGRKQARLGIIAAKKTLPGAVSRNRVKRLIREVFRQHNIKLCELDLVVMVRRAYALSAEGGRYADNLNMLFSRVENRCAE